MNHFGDPGYRCHTLMFAVVGVTALRPGQRRLLPFDFASYASNIRQFVNELSKKQRKSERIEHVGTAAPGCPAGRARQPPHWISNWCSTPSMTSKVPDKRLDDSARRALAPAQSIRNLPPPSITAQLQVERNWLNPDGIRPPVFKHILLRRAFYLMLIWNCRG